MKKSIAIIPARGGSKRIPRKNIKDFFGKPLIAYSIQTALESKLFDRVIVSTDDEEIAQIAREYGADVPFIRPKELSDDFSITQVVIEHALQYLRDNNENYDYYCTIYATAPLLQSKYLIEGFEKLTNTDAINVFSATSMPFPIQRTFKIDTNDRCEMFTPEHYITRSQDLEEAYQDAGQFYWSKIGKKSDEIMFGKDSIPIILPRHLVQDIDTLEDWTRAEKLYQNLYPDIYDEWNNKKKEIHTRKNTMGFREKDILFLSIGKNIGYESYGKGSDFLRPILVLKKFGQDTFLGIPLSNKGKKGKFYFSFSYKKDILSTALLTQTKIFDSKRIKYRSGKIHQNDFEKLWESYIRLITPTLKREGSA